MDDNEVMSYRDLKSREHIEIEMEIGGTDCLHFINTKGEDGQGVKVGACQRWRTLLGRFLADDVIIFGEVSFSMWVGERNNSHWYRFTRKFWEPITLMASP